MLTLFASIYLNIKRVSVQIPSSVKVKLGVTCHFLFFLLNFAAKIYYWKLFEQKLCIERTWVSGDSLAWNKNLNEFIELLIGSENWITEI